MYSFIRLLKALKPNKFFSLCSILWSSSSDLHICEWKANLVLWLRIRGVTIPALDLAPESDFKSRSRSRSRFLALLQFWFRIRIQEKVESYSTQNYVGWAKSEVECLDRAWRISSCRKKLAQTWTGGSIGLLARLSVSLCSVSPPSPNLFFTNQSLRRSFVWFGISKFQLTGS